MGRAMNAILIVWAMDILLFLFEGQVGLTSITTVLLNPYAWSTLTIFTDINAILAVAGTVGLVAGLYFIRNEWIIYASFGAIILTFGFKISDFISIIGSSNMFGDATYFVTSLMFAPIILYFIWNIIEFGRGKDN